MEDGIFKRWEMGGSQQKPASTGWIQKITQEVEATKEEGVKEVFNLKEGRWDSIESLKGRTGPASRGEVLIPPGTESPDNLSTERTRAEGKRNGKFTR